MQHTAALLHHDYGNILLVSQPYDKVKSERAKFDIRAHVEFGKGYVHHTFASSVSRFLRLASRVRRRFPDGLNRRQKTGCGGSTRFVNRACGVGETNPVKSA